MKNMGHLSTRKTVGIYKYRSQQGLTKESIFLIVKYSKSLQMNKMRTCIRKIILLLPEFYQKRICTNHLIQ